MLPHVFVLAVLCVTCASGASPAICGATLATPTADLTGQSDQGADYWAALDKQIETTIKAGKAFEAREWLKPEHTNHASLMMSNRELLEWVNKFYAVRAKKLWVSHIAADGHVQVCHEVLLEMPKETDARKAVLKLRDEFYKMALPTPDHGTHYLLISLE